MTTTSPRPRHALALVAAAALLTTTGCGVTIGKEEKRIPGAVATATANTPASTPSAAASTSPSASAGVSPSDAASSGATSEPKDLLWSVGKAPASWKQLIARGDGTQQWRVAQRCLLTLEQPGGLPVGTPTASDTVKAAVTSLEKGIKVPLTAGAVRQVPFRVEHDFTSAGTTPVSVVDFENTSRGVQGQVYAVRGGTFGLVAISICSGGTFDQVDRTQIQPFLKELTVQKRY